MKPNVVALMFFSAFLTACGSASDNNSVVVVGTSDTEDSTTGTDGLVTDGNSNTESGDSSTNTGDTTSGITANDIGSTGTDLNGVITSRTTNGIVNSVGLIKVEPVGVTVNSTRGLFGDLPESRTDEQIRDWYIPPTDSCEIVFLNEEAINTDEFVVFDQDATLVSAGNSLVFTDDNGTYATLPLTDGSFGPEYRPEVEINQAPGTGLTVDIPGDGFTSFTNIDIPPAPALNYSSPDVEAKASADTLFQWQPNSQPGSLVSIYTSGLSSSSNEPIFIGCSALDDGEFTFPEETQALMGSDFEEFWMSSIRIVYNVAADGDSMVFIANSIASNLNGR